MNTHSPLNLPSRRTFLWLLLAGLLLLVLLPPSSAGARPRFAPLPGVNVPATQDVFIGNTFSFDLTFTNTGDIGYGPFIDLIIPTAGADGYDGVTFLSASFLGASINTYTLNMPTAGCYDHPFARIETVPPGANSQPAQVCVTEPSQLVVFELPIGSYTPGQPDLTITVNAELSQLADLGVPLTFYTRSGFRYGEDPLDNACCDPTVFSHSTINTPGWPSFDINPIVATISKTYIGPEGETATGPNFPRQYVIALSIANPQPLNNLVISDILPNDAVITGLTLTQPPGLTLGVDYTISATPPFGPVNPPGNTFDVTFLVPVIGGSGGDDVVVVIDFYTPELNADTDPVLSPTTGDDELSTNAASFTAIWTPIDVNDPVTPTSGGGVCPEACASVTNKSIAVQKSNTVSSSEPKPEDIITYTLDFQVSDYFTFGDVTLVDVFSDGQTIVDNPLAPTGFFAGLNVPTLDLRDASGNSSTGVAFTPFFLAGADPDLGATPEAICANPAIGAANLVIDTRDIDNAPDGSGDTVLIFCVSKFWEQQFPATNGIILGDAAGGTVGLITYQTEILDEFWDAYGGGPGLSGDRSVDQGDVLSNSVVIRGSVRSNIAPYPPTGFFEEDNSGSGVTIARGELRKTIYAINGNTTFTEPVYVQIGDVVTYRIRYNLPSSDIEDLNLTDYLPLPIFSVAGFSATFDNTVSAAAPPAGQAKYGPLDTFNLIYDRGPGPIDAPQITVDLAENTVSFFYDEYDTIVNIPSEIDILLSVEVQDVTFADGLFLTNFVNQEEGSTNSGSASIVEIVQIIVTRPVLDIVKSVIASDNPAALFAPPLPSTATISPPGTAGVRYTGRIYSPGSAGAPGALPSDTPITAFNQNVSGLQAGDVVTFMISLENLGTGLNGAFDVFIRDNLPPGFIPPATVGDLNLQASLGDGTPLTIVGLGANTNSLDLFTPQGIRIVGPGGNPSDVVCQHIDAGLGENIIIVTYDLELQPDVSPSDEIVNVAELINYAAQSGGNNFVEDEFPNDDATVTILAPAIDKLVTGTSEPHTTGTQLVPGEEVTYTVTVTVPQGESTSTTITDTLPANLEPISWNTTIVDPDITITGTGIGTFAGQTLTVPLGTVTNSDTDPTTDETIVVTYTARVRQAAVHGNIITNTANYNWTNNAGPQSVSDTASISIIEPLITIVKTANPTTGDANDVITYTLTVTANASRPTAFDLDLNDLLTNPYLNLEVGTVSFSSGVAGTVVEGNTVGDTTVRITWDELQPGQNSVYTFQIRIGNSVPPGTLTNTATVDWSSLPAGDPGNDVPEEKGYTTSDDATISVTADLTKSIVHTSEAGSTGNNVLIGEIVRYRLVIGIPEGVIPNMQIQDNLPTGLQFFNDGTAMVVFVSNEIGQLTSSTLSGPGLAVTGTTPVATPTFVLPDAAVSNNPTTNVDTYGSGTDVYFSLGTITNTNIDNAQGEFVIIEFNALVMNIAGNGQGTNRVNNFTFWVDGVNGGTSNSVTVTTRLPTFTLTKGVSDSNPRYDGNVDYTITLTHTNAFAPAYNVVLTDVINETNLTVTACTASGGGSCNIQLNTPAVGQRTIVATWDVIPVTEVRTVTFNAAFPDTAPIGVVIPNVANLTWTSLPGDNGTTPNATGSTTPGTPGSTTGERTGSGVSPNNFNATAFVNITLRGMSLGNFVWHDANNNGIVDVAETPIQGVSLSLFDAADATFSTPLDTQITNAAGGYLFDNLRHGDYVVRVNPVNFNAGGVLENYRSTTGVETGFLIDHISPDTFNDNGIDETDLADLLANGVVTSTITLALDSEPLDDAETPLGPGNAADIDSNLTVDFGFFIPMSLGNFVWFDLNNNGLVDGGETPIAGVLVNLYDAGDLSTIIATDTTDAAGGYLFDDLMPGGYVVEVDATNFQSGGVLEGYLSSTPTEIDPNGNVDHTVATGLQENGINDPDPATNGIRSNTVVLAFNTEPTGEALLLKGLGRAIDVNSNLTVDFGFFIPMSLGNFVWYDEDNNGLVDAGELPVENVVVNLYRASDLLNILATTTTDTGGFYLFDDLGADDYVVEIDAVNFQVGNPLEGYNSSTPTEIDPNDDADHTAVSGVQENGLFDADPATNGIRSGTVTLTLFSEPTGELEGPQGIGNATRDDNSNLTIDFGFYRPMSLGNFVWFDLNNNGVFDVGETPIAGVTVNLYLASDLSTVIQTDVTDAAGGYLFTELMPGDYVVEVQDTNFQTGGPLEGYLSSLPTELDPNDDVDQNDNGLNDSAPDVNGIFSGVVTLAYDSEPLLEDELLKGRGASLDINSNLTVDFGFFIPMSLGNFVWYDENNNGLVDAGELPAEGVVINLYRDSDPLTILDTTTTDAGGYYLFDLLGADDYFVHIPAGNFAIGQPLHGYASSLPTEIDPNDNGDHTAVSGVQENGLNDLDPEINGIFSGVITLTLNSEPLGEEQGPQGTGIATDANSNLTLDFGFYQVMSLGNYVWFDANNNGLVDAGELGIDGVTLNLYLASDLSTIIDTTTTDADGFYLFDDLMPGDYVVEIPDTNFQAGGALEGYLSSTPTEINPNDNADHTVTSGVHENGLNSGNPAVTGVWSNAITLAYGTEPLSELEGAQGTGTASDPNSNLTLDFGFYLPFALGNRVWFDINNNGLEDAGEVGFDDVAVTLFRASDLVNPLATTTTNITGYYVFDMLGADDYVVRIDASNFLPAGALAGYRSSTPTELDPNDDVDQNDNGIELPNYLIIGVFSGTVTLSAGNEPLGEPTGGLSTLALDPQTNLTVDFGFFIPLSLGNRVWYDNNDNGLIDAGEQFVPGVELNLYRASDTSTVIDTTTTDANGYYLFDMLGADDYLVEVAPSNFQTGAVLETYRSSTPTELDPNDDVDNNDNGINDPDPATNGIRSGTVTLTIGGEPIGEEQGPQGIGSAASDNNSNLTVDFGFVAPLSLGNLVWFDMNNNGLRDAGEPGINGVTVLLFEAGDTTTPIDSTVTIGGGYYLFDDLPSGDYVVGIAQPNFEPGGPLWGYFSSTPTAANPNNNVDNDDNGIDPATPGLRVLSGVITLTLESEPVGESQGPQGTGNTTDINSNLTVDFGFYALSSLGDRVWNDTNANGVQDAGEPGIAGVVVNLYLASDLTTPIATTTTNGTGYYLFRDLFPGDYVVEFVRPSPEYASSPQYLTSPAFDSNPHPFTGLTEVITLGLSEFRPDIDAGFYLQSVLPAAIGDRVWLDANNDGIQNAGETGVAGVVVHLYRDGDLTPFASTLTDTDGLYLFSGLEPGDYFIEFELPSGFTFTLQNVGSDLTDSDADTTTGRTVVTNLESGETDLTWDAGLVTQSPLLLLGDYVWFDANDNGQQDGGETGVGGVIVRLYTGAGDFLGQAMTDTDGFYLFNNLLPGEYRVQFVLPPGYGFTLQDVGPDATDSDADVVTGLSHLINLLADDLTIDAGLVLADTGVSGPVGSIGTTVWFDTNADGILNPGELGIPGVIVRLYNNAGLLLSQALTDADGNYLFSNLPGGQYLVEFVPPEGFSFTILNAGSDPAVDSDANQITGRTVVINLAPGEDSLIWFAGLVNAPTSIGFISFDAIAVSDTQVTLEWVMVSESGISGYAILRSATTDINDAVEVGLVPATGQGTYTLVDPLPVPGSYTYWLIELEASGFSHILDQVTVFAVPSATTYTIYLPLLQR